jgi:flagellar motor switch protein FliN/FliY
VNTEDALTQLGESTAEAVVQLLATLAPKGIERGAVVAEGADADPFHGIPAPAVVANVSYVDGVTGGNLFVVSVRGARLLAASMMGLGPESVDESGELSELELSAVSEAANQMMAAAASATSRVLGEEVEIGVPTTTLVKQFDETLFEKTPHQAHVPLSLFGEPCRLVQLVPNAFVVRIGRAFGEQEGALIDGGDAPAAAGGGFDGALLRDVKLRVWAELGRAHMPLGRAVGLASGAVVELDRPADDPVDIYVNGRRFAYGRLMLADDGEWAVQIDEIIAGAAASASTNTPYGNQEGVQ